jgi:ferric enterobactin receptor
MYLTRDNGCPAGLIPATPCAIFGNEDRDPEISVNKEIGIAYNAFQQTGLVAGLTYIHNDCKNKIIADMGGDSGIPPIVNGYRAFKWFNGGPAIVDSFEGNLRLPLLGPHGDTLSWNNNLTWMLHNESKKTDQPLSVIPKYTLNSTLDWRPTEKLSFMFLATFYGKRKPRTINLSNYSALTGSVLKERGAYALYSSNSTYKFGKRFSARFRINNLANKWLCRVGSNSDEQGALKYSEPGRAYYVNLTFSF